MSESNEQRTPSLLTRFPNRATRWQLRERVLQFQRRPLLMGIVNVTPDSFSDGGKFREVDRAVEHGLQLAAEGADMLDIGGESTRPYATPVEQDEELRRIEPVVKKLCQLTDVPVSIDTTKARIAQAALDAGAEIINDISGLEFDPEMISVAKRYQAGICAMHIQGTPQTMQDAPHYENVVAEVNDYLGRRRQQLEAAGIDADRICLDPGIGFGKTHQHNVDLIRRCGEFHLHGRPLLVGHSRKGFMAKVLGDKTADRTAATVGTSLALATSGVQVLRVHDVRPVRDALLLFDVCGGIETMEEGTLEERA